MKWHIESNESSHQKIRAQQQKKEKQLQNSTNSFVQTTLIFRLNNNTVRVNYCSFLKCSKQNTGNGEDISVQGIISTFSSVIQLQKSYKHCRGTCQKHESNNCRTCIKSFDQQMHCSQTKSTTKTPQASIKSNQIIAHN